MASPQIEKLADSPLLKLATAAIAVFFIPVTLAVGTRILDRVERMDTMMQSNTTQSAVTQERVQSSEVNIRQLQVQMQQLNDLLIRHDMQIQMLKIQK